MGNPVVSIVITVKNRRDELIRLLESVERQTFKDYEVIVVDNFSTDGTFEAACNRPGIRAVQMGPERHKQRAHGDTFAMGKYIMHIDSDMELDAGVIEECMHLGETGYDALVIPERAGGEGFWAECQKLEKQCYLNDPWVEAADRFIRKELYDRVGGYRTDIVGPEDYELHDALTRAGARIGRCTQMISHYEETRFWRVVRKKFYYGSQMSRIFVETPLAYGKRFALPVKPAFLRNWRLLLRNPVIGAGLLLMKLTQYAAGTLGVLAGSFRKGSWLDALLHARSARRSKFPPGSGRHSSGCRS